MESNFFDLITCSLSYLLDEETFSDRKRTELICESERKGGLCKVLCTQMVSETQMDESVTYNLSNANLFISTSMWSEEKNQMLLYIFQSVNNNNKKCS